MRSRRLELKKVLGEENPKDLLTKHSLPKERLVKLTALSDCHFNGGRAESAPHTRTAPSNTNTIAPVSYTHPTPPTTYPFLIPVVRRSLTIKN